MFVRRVELIKSSFQFDEKVIVFISSRDSENPWKDLSKEELKRELTQYSAFLEVLLIHEETNETVILKLF